jgi:alpha-amylase
VEFNLTLLTDRAEDRYIRRGRERHPVGEPAVWQGAGAIRLVDDWQGRELRLQSKQLKRTLYYPVYTVSSSEGGFERTYQGSCLMLGFEPQALSDGIEIKLSIAATRGEPAGH